MRSIVLLIMLLVSRATYAQITHTWGISAGVNQTLFLAKQDFGDNRLSIFKPTFSLDYSKHGPNTFWGGFGAGYSYRQAILHEYANGQLAGINLSELWLRVRAGLQFERSFITHMPFISLGVGQYAGFNFFSKYTGLYTGQQNIDPVIENRLIRMPFIELGHKIINSDFRKVKRNVSFSFILRYYPTPLFREPIPFEYEFQEYKSVQYQLLELGIVAALQQNIQR